jgi:hypothetical protein
MSNIYDILFARPSLDEKDSYVEIEEMANSLVNSGRLRSSTDEGSNFVHFDPPGASFQICFSLRELRDQEQKSRERIAASLRTKDMYDERIEFNYEDLKRRIKKSIAIPPWKEMAIARIICQSAHMAVIKLLLLERAEVFVSYEHNVGNLMNIRDWQLHGSASGLQATRMEGAAIYVSCGGDPFVEDNMEGRSPYDGFPALARMMVIAAQELGHFADIIRSPQGHWVSRHSADGSGRRAKENVRLARLADIQNMQNLKRIFYANGLDKLVYREQMADFYEKSNIKGLRRRFNNIRLFWRRFIFVQKCSGIKYLKNFPMKPEGGGRLGQNLAKSLDDMLFNLAPKASAYERDNPTETEAVACIEALARVPQQVIKWGHHTTRAAMVDLYKIYYTQLIPSCVQAWENMSGEKMLIKYTKPRKKLF